MGGKERKEVLKLGRWEKRKEIANEKYQITNESSPFVMGWMNPAHLRWAWMNVKI